MDWWQELLKDLVLLVSGGLLGIGGGWWAARGERRHQAAVRMATETREDVLAAQERLRNHLLQSISDTRHMANQVLIDLRNLALGIERKVRTDPMVHEHASIQLLGSDDVVREWIAVVKMLTRLKRGDGVPLEQQRRVTHLIASMAGALSEQEMRVLMGDSPLWASDEAMEGESVIDALYVPQSPS